MSKKDDNKVAISVVNVNTILNKYGFTSGKPSVDMYKNLEVATKAYVGALCKSGFTPTEVDNKLHFVNGIFSVEFEATKWHMLKNGVKIDSSHYGNGSIKLARWHVKHS